MLGLRAFPVARVSNAHPGPFAVMADGVRGLMRTRVRCAYPGYRSSSLLEGMALRIPVARVSNAHPGPFAVMPGRVLSLMQTPVRCAYPGYRVF